MQHQRVPHQAQPHCLLPITLQHSACQLRWQQPRQSQHVLKGRSAASRSGLVGEAQQPSRVRQQCRACQRCMKQVLRARRASGRRSRAAQGRRQNATGAPAPASWT